jgi:hypothetical protein
VRVTRKNSPHHQPLSGACAAPRRTTASGLLRLLLLSRRIFHDLAQVIWCGLWPNVQTPARKESILSPPPRFKGQSRHFPGLFTGGHYKGSSQSKKDKIFQISLDTAHHTLHCSPHPEISILLGYPLLQSQPHISPTKNHKAS